LEEKIFLDLKGADYDKKLIWHTHEGFDVKPYYRAEDLKSLKYCLTNPGEFPFVRGCKTTVNDWEIREDVTVENIESANKYVLQILNRGVTSPGFKIKYKIIDSKEKLAQLLDGIEIDCVRLNLLAGKDTPQISAYFIQIAEEKKLNTSVLKGSFDFDPIGNLTVNGNFYTDEDEDLKRLKLLLIKHSRPYHYSVS